MNELLVTNPILLHTGGIIDLSDRNRPDEIQKTHRTSYRSNLTAILVRSSFVQLCYIGSKNDLTGNPIFRLQKIDKFKLSIRKVPKTSDYRFLADYSDNQLAKSLKRFEIRWVT